MSLEEPRTLLEQLVAQGQHTWPEVHAQFDKHARVMAVESGERAATVGWRQLQRIAAGEVTKPHPSTVRVLQRQFNRKIHELLGPPNRAESRPEERDVLSGHQFGSLEVAYVPSKIGHETEVDARESQFDRIAPRRPDSSVVDESVMHVFRTGGKSIPRKEWSASANRETMGLRDDLPFNAQASISRIQSDSGQFIEFHLESIEINRMLEASDIGPKTLDQLSSAVKNLGVKYLHVHLIKTLKEASLMRQYVMRLIDGKLTLTHRKQLYSIAGWLTALVGLVSFDNGEGSALVDGHLQTALNIADETGHTDLTAWIRGTQALAATFDNRPQIAIEAAQAGRRSAARDSIMMVRLLALEARAHAFLGDRMESEKCLALTERAFDYVDRPLTSSIFSFDRPYLPFYAGTCYSWLGQPEKAERYSRAAIQLCDSAANDWPVARVSARVDLANSLIAQKKLDEAKGITLECFEICRHGRNTDITRKELGNLSRTLEVATGSHQPNELIEQFNVIFPEGGGD